MTYNTSAFGRFLNREEEIDIFKGLLNHEQHRILLIHGLAGMGKTFLLHRLYELCNDLKVLPIKVDFRTPRLRQKEPDDVIRVLGEQIGKPFAEQVTQLAPLPQQYATLTAHNQGAPAQSDSSGGGISFFGDVQVGGDLVARDKITYDLTLNNSTVIVDPTRALLLVNSNRESQRDDSFRAALTALVAEQRVILFFDHYEDATERMSQWLQEQLLNLHLDGRKQFANLWIVVGGCKVPLQDEVDEWWQVLYRQQVGPLADKVIYLFCTETWGLEEQVIDVLIKSSKRNTKHLFLNLRNYVEASSSEDKDR